MIRKFISARLDWMRGPAAISLLVSWLEGDDRTGIVFYAGLDYDLRPYLNIRRA